MKAQFRSFSYSPFAGPNVVYGYKSQSHDCERKPAGHPKITDGSAQEVDVLRRVYFARSSDRQFVNMLTDLQRWPKANSRRSHDGQTTREHCYNVWVFQKIAKRCQLLIDTVIWSFDNHDAKVLSRGIMTNVGKAPVLGQQTDLVRASISCNFSVVGPAHSDFTGVI
jgi:hypothetical protein